MFQNVLDTHFFLCLYAHRAVVFCIFDLYLEMKMENRISHGDSQMDETMEKRMTVALVAHDAMKRDLAEWVAWNWEKLLSHRLVCTGTTGRIVAETLMSRRSKDAANSRFDITMLKSGPLGGDQQLGSMIANSEIDMLVFFWDPMSAQPHDVDVKALLRLASLYNVPTAINRSSADYMISSPLMAHDDYKPEIKDYTSYIERTLK